MRILRSYCRGRPDCGRLEVSDSVCTHIINDEVLQFLWEIFKSDLYSEEHAINGCSTLSSMDSQEPIGFRSFTARRYHSYLGRGAGAPVSLCTFGLHVVLRLDIWLPVDQITNNPRLLCNAGAEHALDFEMFPWHHGFEHRKSLISFTVVPPFHELSYATNIIDTKDC